VISQRRRHPRISARLLVCLTPLLPAAPAFAQPTDPAAAQALFDEAKRLLEAGRVADACPQFLHSFKLDPKPGAAFNLGACYEKNGQTASAWARYLEAASLAEQAGQADRAAYARDAAKAIEPKLARLTVMVQKPAPGLEVRRDGVLIDATAWGMAVPVDPGQHVLEARAPAKRPWSRTVDVAAGDAKVRIEVPAMQDLPGAGEASDAALAARGGAPRDPVAAQELFDEGKRLVEAGKVAEACPKLLASLKLDPKPGAAFKLGECYEKNGQTASAWARYLEAAALAEQAGQAERAAYARDAAKVLEPRLARLTIAVPKPAVGLVVRRDGEVVVASKLGTAVPVDSGKHVLEATTPGKAPWSKTIEVAAGDVAARIEVPELPDPAPPPVATGPSTQKIAGAVLMGASVLGFVVGGALVAVAHGQSSDLAAKCPSRMACDPTLGPEISSYRASGGGAIASFIAGGAMLGTGVAVFLTAPTASTRPVHDGGSAGSADSAGSTPKPPGAFVAPRLGLGTLWIEGAF
jgi:Flp pilus assembly protein TadD